MATKKDGGVCRTLKHVDARLGRLEELAFPNPAMPHPYRSYLPPCKNVVGGFKVGDSIRYCHDGVCPPTWSGVVIERPSWCKASGNNGPFVWVVRQTDNHIYGIYPWNLTKENNTCY